MQCSFHCSGSCPKGHPWGTTLILTHAAPHLARATGQRQMQEPVLCSEPSGLALLNSVYPAQAPSIWKTHLTQTQAFIRHPWKNNLTHLRLPLLQALG